MLVINIPVTVCNEILFDVQTILCGLCCLFPFYVISFSQFGGFYFLL